MNLNRKCLVVAMACAMPWISAHAQSAADLQKEIELLKAQLRMLQEKIEAVANKPAAGGVDPEEFNRIKIKVESAEDNTIAAGMANLKINGMIDPTFVYNRRQNQSGFVFLNNFDGRNNSSAGNAAVFDGYSYDNSYFGQAMFDIQKETESGTKWRLTLAPHKSASSGYNFGSIVHEASVSIPVAGPATRLIAGQIPDWSGYEYIWSHQQPLISHNLLFDFTIPSFYSGIGMEFTRGKWISKFMVGNINQARKGSGDKTPGLTYRVDYSKGEFNGFGFAGSHSFSSAGGIGRYNVFEVDGYFIRGNWVLQGQIGAGSQKGVAFGGGDARWTGLSGLAGYKLTPRLQLTARADLINNRKNGGGVFGSSSFGDPTVTSDDRNGFGPAWEDDGSGTNTWVQNDLTRGVNRSALSLGVSYLLNQNTTLKAEYRLDRASGAVFWDVRSNGYSRSNSMIGLSAVVSF